MDRPMAPAAYVAEDRSRNQGTHSADGRWTERGWIPPAFTPYPNL